MRYFSTIVLAGVVASGMAARGGEEIVCRGKYPLHVQGVATDGTNIYWSFTSVLVKTDRQGNELARFEQKNAHMGDITWHAGKVYAGYNGFHVGFDEIWVFDDATLSRVRTVRTPETVFCNNGIEWCEGSFYVIGNMPKYARYNYIFEYDENLRFRGARFVDSGWTYVGLQTIIHVGECMLCGYYGSFENKELPCPAGTFVVKAKDMPIKGLSRECPPLVPIVVRDLECTAEGALVLDGRVWVVKGLGFKDPVDPKNPLWSAKLMPSVQLSKYLKSGK